LLNGRQALKVFLLYWVVVFVLYVPAAEAGRVGDFPGWVRFLNSVGFWDYINRSESGIVSLYQFTQVVTLFFYKFFGANAWAWHVLYVTMQAVNALLMFVFFRQLFTDSQVKYPVLISAIGGFLFCVSPYISEVVVWEPAFHYLLGLMLMLGVLWNVQQFIKSENKKYAWYGGGVFFLSCFSLEVFYLTPFFVLALGLYYAYMINYNKKAARNTFLYFTVPQAVMFVLYMITLKLAYRSAVAHIGAENFKFDAFTFSKALKIVYHVVFLGRFYPPEWRKAVYHFAETLPGMALFYGIVTAAYLLLIARFRSLGPSGKATGLLFVFVSGAVCLIFPMWFPETGLVIFDRYLYVLVAFTAMFLPMLLYTLLPRRNVLIGAALILALANARYAHRANAYWQQSAEIVNNLVYTFPNDPTKKVLLLNLPECLDGVQMIGSRDDGEFRMMYNAIMPNKVSNPIYDVEAYYMLETTNGANVRVLNDSTIRVTLNEWGTWWLYYGFGAGSYETADYKVNMRDVGHMYELTLKHDPKEYLLLYSVGKQWKVVDWNKKEIDQR
jgi:hypothetical protein